MASLKGCVEHFLPKHDDQEAFALWAFGPDYKSLPYSPKFMDAWNERHSDKLMLKRFGEISNDIEKMVEIWKNDSNLT